MFGCGLMANQSMEQGNHRSCTMSVLNTNIWIHCTDESTIQTLSQLHIACSLQAMSHCKFNATSGAISLVWSIAGVNRSCIIGYGSNFDLDVKMEFVVISWPTDVKCKTWQELAGNPSFSGGLQACQRFFRIPRILEPNPGLHSRTCRQLTATWTRLKPLVFWHCSLGISPCQASSVTQSRQDFCLDVA